MQLRPRHLQVHTGGVPADPRPTAEQLKLGETNHGAVQARQRSVMAAVRAETYRGRDGKPHRFEARHQVVMAELVMAANKYGEVLPRVLTLRLLADQLERTYTNVKADVRDLEQALLLWKRPVVDGYGRRFVIVIPGMVAPLDDRSTAGQG